MTPMPIKWQDAQMQITEQYTSTVYMIIYDQISIFCNPLKYFYSLSSFLQVFLAVELPLGVITILHIASSTIHEFLDYSVVKPIIIFINLCICLSYPLNFGIYCGMSQQFRDTFKQLLFPKSANDRSHTQYTNVSLLQKTTERSKYSISWKSKVI